MVSAGVEALAAGGDVAETACAADSGKFRKARYLDAPSFVVAEVKVEDVHFIHGHDVQYPAKLLW